MLSKLTSLFKKHTRKFAAFVLVAKDIFSHVEAITVEARVRK